MVLRRGTLNKPNTHSICRIENTTTDLKIMCLRKHIYLRYFIKKLKSYQEMVLVSKFVHTTSCSCQPFTNTSSLNKHMIFPNIPLGICTS